MKEKDFGVKWFNVTFYPTRKTGRAVRYEDGVLPRLREQEITLFTPWGPRYRWESRGVKIEPSHREVETLQFLANTWAELQANMLGKNWRWVFLGADLYGTRINDSPPEIVSEYFENLRCWLKKVIPIAEFHLWSEFDSEAAPHRRYIRENFDRLVSYKVIARATQTAERLGVGSDPRDYLVERLAEAAFIEELLHPIKVSAVARHKDDFVDGDLPRLYLLPQDLHAPWL